MSNDCVTWILYTSEHGHHPHAVLKCDPNEDFDNDEPDYVGLPGAGSICGAPNARAYDSLEALLAAPELTPEHITKIILTFI